MTSDPHVDRLSVFAYTVPTDKRAGGFTGFRAAAELAAAAAATPGDTGTCIDLVPSTTRTRG